MAYRLGYVLRRSLEDLGKGLCVEGVFVGVAYRLGCVFRRSLEVLGKGLGTFDLKQ